MNTVYGKMGVPGPFALWSGVLLCGFALTQVRSEVAQGASELCLYQLEGSCG